MEEKHTAHREHQRNGGRFAHLECPRNVRHIVEHYVRQWRIPVHVRDAVVNDYHDERGEHEHKEHIDVADK